MQIFCCTTDAYTVMFNVNSVVSRKQIGTWETTRNKKAVKLPFVAMFYNPFCMTVAEG